MITLSNVSKGYGERLLFSGGHFTLGRGERCAVVGRNGSGKTTLFRLITGEESADSGKILTPKHYRIGTLPQHIHFKESTILAEALLALPGEAEGETHTAKIVLTGLGLTLEQMENDPKELSGGFQLRLQLAKALLADPDCLLLDEPTNYLDIVAIRWLESFLKQWRGELMVISHDRAFVDEVSTHTLGISRGRLLKVSGGTEKYFEVLLQEEEFYEKRRLQAEKQRLHLESYIERFGAKASKASQAKSKEKALERLPALEQLAAAKNLLFSFKEAPFPGKRMLEIDRLKFAYPGNGGFTIDGFSLRIQKRERIALIGKNGCGKSTLLALLAGVLKPEGETRWRSDNLRIGYFGQTHIQRLKPNLTVEEEIAQANPELTHVEVKGLCAQMLFSGDLASKPISALSGGEKSRVLLGKILATHCNLLLLDEPTHHLDMESVDALLSAANHFAGAVVLVTHDEEILRHFGERLIVCKKEGIELFEGNYSTFLNKKGWEEEASPSLKKPSHKEVCKEKRKEKAAQNKKIALCEAAILENEEGMALQERLLASALKEGNGIAIAKHSLELAKHQEAIDALFQEL